MRAILYRLAIMMTPLSRSVRLLWLVVALLSFVMGFLYATRGDYLLAVVMVVICSFSFPFKLPGEPGDDDHHRPRF